MSDLIRKRADGKVTCSGCFYYENIKPKNDLGDGICEVTGTTLVNFYGHGKNGVREQATKTPHKCLMHVPRILKIMEQAKASP